MQLRASQYATGGRTATCPPRQRPAAAARCRTAAPIRCELNEDLASAAVGAGTAALFEPLKLGPYELKHRIVMAPLTRCRWGRCWRVLRLSWRHDNACTPRGNQITNPRPCVRAPRILAAQPPPAGTPFSNQRRRTRRPPPLPPPTPRPRPQPRPLPHPPPQNPRTPKEPSAASPSRSSRPTTSSAPLRGASSYQRPPACPTPPWATPARPRCTSPRRSRAGGRSCRWERRVHRKRGRAGPPRAQQTARGARPLRARQTCAGGAAAACAANVRGRRGSCMCEGCARDKPARAC
jgi:hypothetical protein